MTWPAPQREEGRIQGQLNHSDSSQYIRELKDQIEELKAEVSAGPPGWRGRGGSPACPPRVRRGRRRRGAGWGAGGAACRPGSVRGCDGAGLQRAGFPPQVRLLKGPPPFEDPLAFDGLGLARHLDEDSLPSSDEELLGVGVGVGAALQDALYPLSPRDARFFRRLERPAKDSEGSSDSDADELAAPYSQGLDN